VTLLAAQIIPVQSPEYAIRLSHRQQSAHQAVWQLLDQIKDPEIPVISLWDLGILQDVIIENLVITIVITPTYSGCPAMREITCDIQTLLNNNGYDKVSVKSRLTPAWTTNWMSTDGRERLREYGIAPPSCQTKSAEPTDIQCPRCHSNEVNLISEFGSTSCKALYQCQSCLEPFDYFKCI
jgi:ring-1,2-phenylacetyl-CoA epoxidase subunit PaaD